MEVIYSQNNLRAVWQVAPPGPADTVQLAHAGAEDLALLHMRASRLAGAFSAQEQGRELWFGVMLVSQGAQSIAMKRCRITLTAGDIAIWRNDVSCDFETQKGVEKLQVLVPAEVMHQHWPSLVPDTTSLKVKTHSAMPALALGFLESLWRQKEYLGPTELHAAIHAALDMLEKGQTMVLPSQSRRTDRLTPILRFLDEFLEDPALGPSSIAQRFGYSLRTLHALFARHGTTVASEIRERRLERCRLDLTRSNPGLTILDLSGRWGFSDASHFSKLFKAKYGVGPKAYRGALGPVNTNHAVLRQPVRS